MAHKTPKFETLREGGKKVMATALAAIESKAGEPETLQLLDEAYVNPKAHVLGFTGPPGVGKSTLINHFIERTRREGKSVGVIAVDPSSHLTGGALLGDRTRIITDPEDEDIYIRSMAARDRLGGLASLTIGAMVLMRARYDVVIIETVGVGQSETDIAGVADTIIFCVQPASGDSLQFMKAGIMELPHIMAITKGDMGTPARRAAADVKGALGLTANMADGWTPEVVTLSSTQHTGFEELQEAIKAHKTWLDEGQRLHAARRMQASGWLKDAVNTRFGEDGVSRVKDELRLEKNESPFSKMTHLAQNILKSRP